MSELNFDTIRSATPVGFVNGYISIPAFSYSGVGWKGASEIVTQFNFTTSKNLVLRGLPAKPDGVNYVPVISWRIGLITHRYKLWADAGERLQEAVYNGEVVKANFKIEIWNIETSESVSNDEAITLITSIRSVPGSIASPVNYEDAEGVEYSDQFETSEMPTTIPITGLEAWFRADLGITGVSTVSAWVDQVNGYTVVQGTALNRPSYSDAGFGDQSRAYLGFGAGSDQHLSVTGLTAFPSGQAFFVCRPISWADTRIIGSTGNIKLTQSTGADRLRFASTATTVTTDDGPAVNTPVIVEMVHHFNGVAFELIINIYDLQFGLIATKTGGLTVGAIPNGTVFSFGDPSGGALTAEMDIAEVILYQAELGADDRTSLIDYLVNRYNVGAIKIPITVDENLKQVTN